MAGEEDKDLMEQSSPRLPKVAQRSDPDILEGQKTSEPTSPRSQEPDVLEEVENVAEKQDRQRASLKASGRVAQTSLPVGEERDDDPLARKVELEERIAELESTMRYMGSGHPKRVTYEVQLSAMQDMLKRIEDALKLAR